MQREVEEGRAGREGGVHSVGGREETSWNGRGEGGPLLPLMRIHRRMHSHFDRPHLVRPDLTRNSQNHSLTPESHRR